MKKMFMNFKMKYVFRNVLGKKEQKELLAGEIVPCNKM